MIAAAVCWLLQDMMQVCAMGFMLVPELFLLTAVYKLLSGSSAPRRVSGWIWFSFAGGLLWDFRWSDAPGMSALLNVLCLSIGFWFWNRTPAGGRSALLFAAIAGGSHVLSGLAHYMAWAVPSQAAIRMFLAQQFFAVPVLILLCVIYALKSRDKAHV